MKKQETKFYITFMNTEGNLVWWNPIDCNWQTNPDGCRFCSVQVAQQNLRKLHCDNVDHSNTARVSDEFGHEIKID